MAINTLKPGQRIFGFNTKKRDCKLEFVLPVLGWEVVKTYIF